MGFAVQFTDRVHVNQIIFAAPEHHHFSLLPKAGCVPQPANQTTDTVSAQEKDLCVISKTKTLFHRLKNTLKIYYLSFFNNIK